MSNAPEDAVDKGMMSRALGSLKRNKGKAGLIGGGLAALGGGAYALSRNSETPKAALLQEYLLRKEAEEAAFEEAAVEEALIEEVLYG